MKDRLEPKDFARLSQCACFNLRKTVRMVTQKYDRFLRPSGIRVTQISLLAHAAKPGMTMTRMAKILGMDRTTLTRNLRPLQKQKLLEVSAGADLRVREIKITPKGHEALAKAFPLWKKAQDWFVERIGASQWHHLVDFLTVTESPRRA